MTAKRAGMLLKVPIGRMSSTALGARFARRPGVAVREASYALCRRCVATVPISSASLQRHGGLSGISGCVLTPMRSLTSGVDYTILNMPALSPTMEAGTIAEWHKAPGNELNAGDVICDVETDKATVAFDVQDDGVLAKIISEAGSGEVSVGDPVAVIVEDADAYDAFAKADAAGEVTLDSAAPSLPASEEPAAEAPPPAPEAPTRAESSPTPAPAPEEPATEAPPAPEVQPAAKEPASSAAEGESTPGSTPLLFKREWGSGVSGSPLAHRMSAEQKRYVERYGSTLQLPVEA